MPEGFKKTRGERIGSGVGDGPQFLGHRFEIIDFALQLDLPKIRLDENFYRVLNLVD